MSRQEVVELATHHKKENDKLLKSLSEKAQSNKALVAEAKKGIAEINAILDDLLREDDDDDESVPAIVVDESAEPTPRPRAFVPGSRPVSSGVDMTKSIQEMHSLLGILGHFFIVINFKFFKKKIQSSRNSAARRPRRRPSATSRSSSFSASVWTRYLF